MCIRDSPYTLKLKVDNNILTVFREKDGVEEKCGSLDVSPYIDLTDPAVAANYDVYVGACLLYTSYKAYSFSR